jgi:phosphate transport system permease protein
MDKIRKEKIAFAVIKILAYISVVFLAMLVGYIFFKGFRVINFRFLTDVPRKGVTEGGIFPAILGTFYLVLVSFLVAVPAGVLSGIYLSEYAPKEGTVIRFIRVSVNVLSGIPSVIFGLFGLAIFVNKFHFGVSILSGGLTLGILILPVIIQATMEALRSVPDSFREASYGLGATKWQTIKNIVLPVGMPGILTGVILSVGRSAGETAPILFTAATFYTGRLPHSIFNEVMALPYMIYGLLTEGTFPAKQIPIAYGASTVLLLFVFAMSLLAIIIRMRSRRMKKW